jgi:hypothetical protein
VIFQKLSLNLLNKNLKKNGERNANREGELISDFLITKGGWLKRSIFKPTTEGTRG